MNYSKELNIEPGKAICYSGFREGQQPGGIVPSYDEIKEDLLICVYMIVTHILKLF